MGSFIEMFIGNFYILLKNKSVFPTTGRGKKTFLRNSVKQGSLIESPGSR